MAETVNQAKSKREYDLYNHISNSNLTGMRKTELLIDLTGKRRTMLEGSAFMLKHPTLRFDDFERALEILNRANSASSLGFVEAALQVQIDAIRRMKAVDLSQEQKSLCLYTLQNMIFALSDFHLAKDKKNDYVPRILQDQYQMLLKGSQMNMDWNILNDSSYSTQYSNFMNPTLLNWKFLDLDLIKKNMKDLSRYQTAGNDAIKNQSTVKNNHEITSWGMHELNLVSSEKLNQILSEALTKFDSNHLSNNVHEFFNFVKDALESQNKDAGEIDYRVLHEIVLATMQRIVEIGNDQQKKALFQQQSNQDGRSL